MFVFLLAAGCNAGARLEEPQTWKSSLYADHALAGRIWDGATGNFVDGDWLAARIAGARYLLLGEKHDNPDHHDLQLMVIRHLIQQDSLAGLTFEMMDSDYQPRLDSLVPAQITDAEELRTALQWQDESWSWEFYGPLLEAAYQAGAPMTAGNLTDVEVSQAYEGALGPEVATVLDVGAVEQLRRDVDESHCGLLPESQFPAMVRVQQLRDFTMAGNMQRPAPNRTTVLIAGNYHVRHDLGVPNYLLARFDDLARNKVVALAFMEVESGEEDPAAYLQQFGPERPFDFIWFTPAISDEDYCESLRERQNVR